MQDLLGTTLILLAACSLSVVATAAFRVPALLGYLAVGALLGPSVSGVIAPGEALTFISELGVALLLFMVGLEFSLGHFWLTRKTVREHEKPRGSHRMMPSTGVKITTIIS